jgi:hypothetical protein
MPIRLAKKIALLVIAVALQACASPSSQVNSDSYFAPAFKLPARGSRIVLLGATSDMKEMAAGEDFVQNGLHQQLRAAGYQVLALDPANYAQMWAEEVDVVGGVFDAATGEPRAGAYTQALGALAQRVSAETGSSLVLRYRLVVRHAPLSGVSAFWDGHTERQPTSNHYGDEHRFSGTTVAISVELVGLASDGSVAFKTFGGMTLPYRANVLDGKHELRPDLFKNDEDAVRGVKLALKPVLQH